MPARPGQERGVDVLRRVDVVGRQLMLELFQEGVVLLRVFALDLAPERRVVGGLAAERQPGRIEAGQRDIEAGGLQRDHFAAQDLLICLALSQKVISMHEGAALVLAQMVDDHAGKVRVAAFTSRHDPPVSKNQMPLGVDAGRHDPPELVEAAHQFPDLLRRVQLRVVLVGDQLVDLAILEPDLVLGHDVLHASALCLRVSRPRPAYCAKKSLIIFVLAHSGKISSP